MVRSILSVERQLGLKVCAFLEDLVFCFTPIRGQSEPEKKDSFKQLVKVKNKKLRVILVRLA